jgi:hypothetical protein
VAGAPLLLVVSEVGWGLFRGDTGRFPMDLWSVKIVKEDCRFR